MNTPLGKAQNDFIPSTRRALEELRDQTEVTTGLLNLLKLQLDHEGHMDEDVYRMFDELLADNALHWNSILGSPITEDAPF